MGPALDAAESARSFEMLRSITLSNATKYVVTIGKFDSEKSAKTFNVERGYPPEPSYLRTLAAWAEIPYRDDPRFRDAYDLFCLKGILARGEVSDYAVVLRNADGFQKRWPKLRAVAEGRPFLTFTGAPSSFGRYTTPTSVIFNLRVEGADGFLDRAWELYVTGAVYAMKPYSLESALVTAATAQHLEHELDRLPQTHVTQ